MLKIFSSLFLLGFLSPIWPLGTNPSPGSPFLIVNKQTNELALVDENRLQTIVSVGTGKTKQLTPEGLFTIIVKAENPYYRKKNILGGVPENPLGARWLGFDALGTDGRTYGIHGTNQPMTIGKYASNGCIRMQNEVITSLYPLIPIGTKVLVTSSKEPFEQLAKRYNAIQE